MLSLLPLPFYNPISRTPFPWFIIENSLAFVLSSPYVLYLVGSSQNCSSLQVTIINLKLLNCSFQVNTQTLCVVIQFLKAHMNLLVD